MRREQAAAPEPEIAPPFSLEMEQTAIGALMFQDAKAVERAMTMLHPRHFYRRLHADIFHAARRVMSRSRDAAKVDFICIYEELRALGKTDSETFAYLQACVDICPSSANIDSYIRVLLDKSKLRHYLALGRKIEQETTANDADAAHLHAAIHNALQAINTHGWCDLDAIFIKGK